MMRGRQTRASDHASEGLPWTRVMRSAHKHDGAVGPFDPMTLECLGTRRRLSRPNHLYRPLAPNPLMTGFQGPPALGGVDGRTLARVLARPRLAYGASG
jgi:hypothetical protein